jgi:hypothetical protein
MPQSQTGPNRVEQLLDGLAPDELTPRDALEFLYRLKAARLDDG